MPREKRPGSLTVVGTGLSLVGHVTAEALSVLQEAEELLYLATNAVTARWLEELNPAAISLLDCYEVGVDRSVAYEVMTERILSPVREGKCVAAAFYGHPGVFADPPHEAIRRARAEGFSAEMLPAISAEDCLIADLGIDPGVCGFQTYGATDFIVRRRKFDCASYLILWQVGLIGESRYLEGSEIWNRAGLSLLREVLLKYYPPEHTVIIYEANPFPTLSPRILRVRLGELNSTDVTIRSTLCIPPSQAVEMDEEMRLRLGLSPKLK